MQMRSFRKFRPRADDSHIQFFNDHVLRIEQLEYEKEGIHWDRVEFVDNEVLCGTKKTHVEALSSND